MAHALGASRWVAEGHGAAFLARLADPGNEAAGVVGFVASLLLAAWQEGAARAAAGSIVRAFVGANPDCARPIMEAALDVASAQLRMHLWRTRRTA